MVNNNIFIMNNKKTIVSKYHKYTRDYGNSNYSPPPLPGKINEKKPTSRYIDRRNKNIQNIQNTDLNYNQIKNIHVKPIEPKIHNNYPIRHTPRNVGIPSTQTNYGNCFDETRDKKEVVRMLLENDIRIYKILIPEINNLNSEEFNQLFEGNYDYQYTSSSSTQIKRLSFKFDNFQTILQEWWNDNKYHKFLKELWIHYSCIEDLKKINDEDKIFAKLESIKGFSEWPQEIKKELITLIKSSDFATAKKIKDNFRKNYSNIDKLITKLVGLKERFSNEITATENYQTKAENIISRDWESIKKIFGKFKEIKNEKFDIKQIAKSFSSNLKDFSDVLGPYFMGNINNLINKLILGLYKNSITNRTKSDKTKEDEKDKKTNKKNKEDEKIIDLILEEYESENFESPIESEEYEIQKIKEILPELQNNSNCYNNLWELTALNFIVFINSGYRAYNCFQMAKQLTKENDFRKRLQAISKNFNEHQISKTFTDEPENNYEIVKKATEDIENDFNDLQQLLTEIKENLDNHINQKKAFIGNIFLEIIKIGYAGYIAFLFSGISFVLGVGNIIFGVGNIVSNGIGLKYTNDLIDANIEILKDAKK